VGQQGKISGISQISRIRTPKGTGGIHRSLGGGKKNHWISSSVVQLKWFAGKGRNLPDRKTTRKNAGGVRSERLFKKKKKTTRHQDAQGGPGKSVGRRKREV